MDSFLFHLQHFFIPNNTNNHRPKLLHASTFSYLLCFLLIIELNIHTISKIRPDILGFATSITTEKLLEYTNNERLKNGAKPVVLSPVLSKAAEKKAQDMFAKNYWAHTAPDGTTPWDFIIGEGYKYTYAGENLARDFDESHGVVEAWMNSPSHRDNLIRGEYQEIGFAVVNGKLNDSETTLVVQMFGTQTGGVVARANNRPQIPVAAAQEIVPPATPTSVPLPTNVPVYEPSQLIDSVPVAANQASLIQVNSLQRSIAFTIAGVLILVLMVDGFVIWRKKTIRIAGHNLAHFIFLATILGIIIIGTSGAIL